MNHTEDIENTLRDVEYLARSANRVTVLGMLAETPSTVRELSDATEMSRATLGRILRELSGREWIGRDGQDYAATRAGSLVIEEFTTMLRRLNTIQILNRALRWFPEEEFGFDLRRLATAEVVSTTRTEALAPSSHVARQIGNSDRVLVVSHAILPDCIAATWQRTVHGHQHAAVVVTREVAETIRDRPEMSTQVREMIGTGQVKVASYHGDVPYVFVVTDDEVNIVLFDVDGAPHAVVTTDDREVLAWAESTFDSFCDGATPLDENAFAP